MSKFCPQSLVGLSLIAVGTVPAIAACLVIGGILTVLSGVQATESYLFLQNSEKLTSQAKNALLGEQESKLFIERVFQPFCDIFGKGSGKDI